MKNLDSINSILRERKDGFSGNFFIPSRWNTLNFTHCKTDPARPGEININPYDYITRYIDFIKKAGKNGEGTKARDVIYAMLPRFFTAWPHDEKKKISTGTFLFALTLLPALSRLGVGIVYLLPIQLCGSHYKKGELSSPYAIKDFYKIEPGLHDELLGAYSDALLEAEFGAFVEACHALGMKVVVDFAFRTAARDNVLMADHPDWFYWIRAEQSGSFRPPTAGDGKKTYQTDARTIKMLYQSPETAAYLSRFAPPPNKIDAEKWEKVKTGGTDELLTRIENDFGITTAPGFSDVINDRQPAWTDVTYLKYYFDPAPSAAEFLPNGQAPYIMQDGASLAFLHGKEKNDALFNYVTGILPFYRKRYNIDGARIDMAHALPSELNTAIVKAIKRLAPDFILWSEELNPEASGAAKAAGYDFISGFSYAAYKKATGAGFNKAILDDGFLCSAVPLVASLETPDTPRCANIHRETERLGQLFLLNSFMPNAIPMINSGQVLYERQPMNLGLDNDENGRFVLPHEDPMYGKIAFFDKCCLHWTEKTDAYAVLCEIAKLREENSEFLHNACFVRHPEFAHHKKLTLLHYKKDHSNLIVAANRSDSAGLILNLEKISGCRNCNLIYDSVGRAENKAFSVTRLILHPIETIILEAN